MSEDFLLEQKTVKNTEIDPASRRKTLIAMFLLCF